MMIPWLSAAKIRNKRALVRVDFNVPMERGKILDAFRIRAHAPTLRFLLKNNSTLILICHIGRPGGKKVNALSAKPIARRLSALLGRRVIFVPDPFEKRWVKRIRTSPPGKIFLLENIRFWPGEEKNARSFAKELARLGDVFVQDAFGVIHRSETSVIGLPKLLPSFGGLLLQKELGALKPLTHNPKRPFVVVMGGAKMETKLHLIRAFVKKADRVLIGGALANTVLAALGFAVGKSRIDKKYLPETRRLALQNRKLLIPHDAVAERKPNGKHSAAKSVHDIRKDETILDIGPDTIRAFSGELKKAKTILWNGPLGLAEKKEYAIGTLTIAKTIAGVRAYKVVGGGDLIAFFEKHHLKPGVSHLATGGGSALALIAGEKLPGLEAIKKK